MKYFLIIPLGHDDPKQKGLFFLLKTSFVSKYGSYPPGAYCYETNLTPEEIGQIMGGN